MNRKEKLEKYFERIGLTYTEPYAPNLEHLFDLHQAHNFTIPYENLDLLRGKPLSLKDDDLYEKFINQRFYGPLPVIQTFLRSRRFAHVINMIDCRNPLMCFR